MKPRTNNHTLDPNQLYYGIKQCLFKKMCWKVYQWMLAHIMVAPVPFLFSSEYEYRYFPSSTRRYSELKHCGAVCTTTKKLVQIAQDLNRSVVQFLCRGSAWDRVERGFIEEGRYFPLQPWLIRWTKREGGGWCLQRGDLCAAWNITERLAWLKLTWLVNLPVVGLRRCAEAKKTCTLVLGLGIGLKSSSTYIVWAEDIACCMCL